MDFSFYWYILTKLKNNDYKEKGSYSNFTIVTIVNFLKDLPDYNFTINKIDNIKSLINDDERKVYSIITDNNFYIRMFTTESAYPDHWDVNDHDSGKSFLHFLEDDGTILNSNFLQDFQDITNIKNISEEIQFYLKLQNKI